MDNILLMAFAILALSLIFCIITFFVIRKKESKKYKKEINELDIKKNEVIGVPILSEIAKVKELVKTDNLKNKLEDWDVTFKVIKDEKISKLNDLISEADFLIDKNDYKKAVKLITSIEIEIESLKRECNKLLEEIKVVTTSEERNRALVTKLKIVFRELKDKFERTKKDYNFIIENIEKELNYIDGLFIKFEEKMEQNDYVEVEKIIIELDKSIKEIKVIIEDSPSIILSVTSLIPSKIDETITLYYRMLRDGYPLDYLNVEYNIKEIKNKLSLIAEGLKKLFLGDYNLQIKTILEYFDNLYLDFDKEKESKDLFRENVKSLEKKINKINKLVKNIFLQLDDIKSSYDIKEEDINKFSILNKKLEKINEDFKILEEYSKNKTFAYSKLNDELNGLKTKLSRLQDDLDYRLHSITSMQDDEYRAKEQLTQIQNLLKKSKVKLKGYKIPVIPNGYFLELREAQEAIREIIRELDKKPIAIKTLNIRVDTARDLVFKIYNKTNDLVKTVILCEKLIVYGNRYRSVDPEINNALVEASELFNKGQYKKSMDIAINALNKVEDNILERIIVIN